MYWSCPKIVRRKDDPEEFDILFADLDGIVSDEVEAGLVVSSDFFSDPDCGAPTEPFLVGVIEPLAVVDWQAISSMSPSCALMATAGQGDHDCALMATVGQDDHDCTTAWRCAPDAHVDVHEDGGEHQAVAHGQRSDPGHVQQEQAKVECDEAEFGDSPAEQSLRRLVELGYMDRGCALAVAAAQSACHVHVQALKTEC